MLLAVISADSISSSLWDKEDRELVVNTLTMILKETPNSKYEFYRGDSFQVVITDATQALKLALELKTAINKLLLKSTETTNENSIHADIRISIGIGEERISDERIGLSDGSAYQYSGRTLDSMKKENRTFCLTTENSEINEEFKVSLLFLEETFKRWSRASAETLYYLLKGYTENEIATTVGISQSAVNYRKKTANWSTIEALIKRYEQVVRKQFIS